MSIPVHRLRVVTVLVTVVMIAGGVARAATATAVATNASPRTAATVADSKPAGVTQTIYQAPEPPQASFTVPTKPVEGKDPFYPRSTLVYGEDATITKNKTNPAPVVAEFFLRGISGTDDNPLAIINNVTFGINDELEVSTKAGKLKIRCLKISKDAGTATIQMGGMVRELRLSPPPSVTPTPTAK